MRAKIKELLRSPHIHISLVTGLSIIVMAYFSKYILPRSIGYLPLAVPPFIASIYEALFAKYPDSKFMKTWIWVAAVLIATFLVVLFYAI